MLSTLVSCASPGSKNPKPFWNYRSELQVEVGGNAYQGFAVTKLGSAPYLDVTVRSPITLNRIEFYTCGRHDVVRNEDKGWFDKVKKTMTYRYQPTAKEREDHCPLYVQAFNDHVQKAWAMVAFRTDQTLPAHIDCNGRGWNYAGVSLCGTKNGIESQLIFDRKVDFEALSECDIRTKDNKSFDLRTKAVGFCKATFSDGERFHDLILHGYDEVTVY